MIVIAPRTTRLRAGARGSASRCWPPAATGTLRNLIAVGNPIPYIGSSGPISLPAPVRDFELRPDFAVVHYWNDTGVWRHWFFPGLHESFGTLWPADPGGDARRSACYALWRGARAAPAGARAPSCWSPRSPTCSRR